MFHGYRNTPALARFVAGVLGLLFIIALSALQARRSAAIQEKKEKAFLQFSFMLPLTGAERIWWIFVSLTAGITEEILYRGFLIHYFFSAPFHGALAVAVIVSCVIFGTGHLYQGTARRNFLRDPGINLQRDFSYDWESSPSDDSACLD